MKIVFKGTNIHTNIFPELPHRLTFHKYDVYIPVYSSSLFFIFFLVIYHITVSFLKIYCIMSSHISIVS